MVLYTDAPMIWRGIYAALSDKKSIVSDKSLPEGLL